MAGASPPFASASRNLTPDELLGLLPLETYSPVLGPYSIYLHLALPSPANGRVEEARR